MKNPYNHTIKAFCELYHMICAIAITILIRTFLPQFPIENMMLTIQNLANGIVIVFLVVRFFHGNSVLIKKCHLDREPLSVRCMYTDLTLMLFQGILLIVIALIDIGTVYFVIVILIFTDALWMGFISTTEEYRCTGTRPYTISWLISNLFTACLMLILMVTMHQDDNIVLNILNMVIVFINTIVNFYMNHKFMEHKIDTGG